MILEKISSCNVPILKVVFSIRPLVNFGEEVKQVMQTGGVSGRQQTGQQLQG